MKIRLESIKERGKTWKSKHFPILQNEVDCPECGYCVEDVHTNPTSTEFHSCDPHLPFTLNASCVTRGLETERTDVDAECRCCKCRFVIEIEESIRRRPVIEK